MGWFWDVLGCFSRFLASVPRIWAAIRLGNHEKGQYLYSPLTGSSEGELLVGPDLLDRP